MKNITWGGWFLALYTIFLMLYFLNYLFWGFSIRQGVIGTIAHTSYPLNITTHYNPLSIWTVASRMVGGIPYLHLFIWYVLCVLIQATFLYFVGNALQKFLSRNKVLN